MSAKLAPLIKLAIPTSGIGGHWIFQEEIRLLYISRTDPNQSALVVVHAVYDETYSIDESKKGKVEVSRVGGTSERKLVSPGQLRVPKESLALVARIGNQRVLDDLSRVLAESSRRGERLPTFSQGGSDAPDSLMWQ